MNKKEEKSFTDKVEEIARKIKELKQESEDYAFILAASDNDRTVVASEGRGEDVLCCYAQLINESDLHAILMKIAIKHYNKENSFD